MMDQLLVLAQIRDIFEPIPGRLMQSELVETVQESQDNLQTARDLLNDCWDTLTEVSQELGKDGELAEQVASDIDRIDQFLRDSIVLNG